MYIPNNPSLVLVQSGAGMEEQTTRFLLPCIYIHPYVLSIFVTFHLRMHH
uniref:Uncharacterized protein n=1 Tax=Anguilla anguilla TaxID=7936 RepID=A0A0E9P701_ANGAN